MVNGCNQSVVLTSSLYNISFPSPTSNKWNDKATLDGITLFVFAEVNLYVEVQVSLKQQTKVTIFY